jgi:hypothetical protein
MSLLGYIKLLSVQPPSHFNCLMIWKSYYRNIIVISFKEWHKEGTVLTHLQQHYYKQ